MECLHCGKPLRLLAKFGRTDFCSDGHRKQFLQQQEELALSRLIETQQRKPARKGKPEKERDVQPPAPLAAWRPLTPPAPALYGVFRRCEFEPVGDSNWVSLPVGQWSRGSHKAPLAPAWKTEPALLPPPPATFRGNIESPRFTLVAPRPPAYAAVLTPMLVGKALMLSGVLEVPVQDWPARSVKVAGDALRIPASVRWEEFLKVCRPLIAGALGRGNRLPEGVEAKPPAGHTAAAIPAQTLPAKPGRWTGESRLQARTAATRNELGYGRIARLPESVRPQDIPAYLSVVEALATAMSPRVVRPVHGVDLRPMEFIGAEPAMLERLARRGLADFADQMPDPRSVSAAPATTALDVAALAVALAAQRPSGCPVPEQASLLPALANLQAVQRPETTGLGLNTLRDDVAGASPETVDLVVERPPDELSLLNAALALAGLAPAATLELVGGSRQAVSRVDGSAQVSVRCQLPKLEPAQPMLELDRAVAVAVALPPAENEHIADGPSGPESPRPFLLAPLVSIRAGTQFSGPSRDLKPVPGCRMTGCAESQNVLAESASPVPPAGGRPNPPQPTLDLIAGSIPEIAGWLPPRHPDEARPVAAGPVSSEPVEPLAPQWQFAPGIPRGRSSPAWSWVETRAAKPRLYRLGIEKIVARVVRPRPIPERNPEHPRPSPLLPRATMSVAGVSEWRQLPPPEPWRPWETASAVWHRVPASPKRAAALMIVLLALVMLWSRLSPPAEPGSAGSGSVLASTWNSLQQGILRRAAVALTDDFRLGLSDWEGQDDWASEWSYDKAGFLRTGSLALYSPSLSLTDYRMEFLGQVEKKSLAWVYRAVDHKNYYAAKIQVVKPGPLPVVTVVRYAVINGKADKPVETPLRQSVRNDTLYRVAMDVRGDNFALVVQDQLVDTWTDSRLRAGGVGFFSPKGERARLRWVGVWHQYDTLGRLCAYLAPVNLQSRERSISP